MQITSSYDNMYTSELSLRLNCVFLFPFYWLTADAIT